MTKVTEASGNILDKDSTEVNALREVLLRCIHPEPSITKAHLNVVERDFVVDGTKTIAHCYAPTLDGNGRLRINALAEFMRDRVLRFVIPRKDVQAAETMKEKSGDISAYIRLHERAKRAFTTANYTGEGGEFLLFALAEKEFSLAQILSKMSLKTSTNVHYHGADGVYASVDSTGMLSLYWGESKLYGNPTNAITNCLQSLAPHLLEGQGEGSSSGQDIVLLNEYADIDDDDACSILKRFLDPNDPQAQKLRICGIALATFDNEALAQAEASGGVWQEIETALTTALSNWKSHIQKRVKIEKLTAFDIHFICLPMACVDDFRKAFLNSLGAAK